MESRKKQYVTPEVVVYGDVREITKSEVGSMGDDGGPIGNKKTS